MLEETPNSKKKPLSVPYLLTRGSMAVALVKALWLAIGTRFDLAQTEATTVLCKNLGGRLDKDYMASLQESKWSELCLNQRILLGRKRLWRGKGRLSSPTRRAELELFRLRQRHLGAHSSQITPSPPSIFGSLVRPCSSDINTRIRTMPARRGKSEARMCVSRDADKTSRVSSQSVFP